MKLRQDQYNYLSKASFLPERIRQLFFLTEKKENSYLVNLSRDQAEEIRDLSGDQL
jgi:hypothetical protein